MRKPIQTVDDLLDNYSPQVREIAHALRQLVRSAAPDLKEEVKPGWKNVTYRNNGVVVAISPYSRHVNLHFYRGVDLDDPDGILTGSGKELRHVRIEEVEDVDADALSDMVQRAVRLDAQDED